MKTIIYKNIFRFNHSQAGSVAVVVALAMVVLLTIFAIVIDTGYLYVAKNKYQNGIEAAAMAGAVSLCDGDPEGVARQVAIDNGLPADSIIVQVGFYDEKDLFENFPEYKDFVAEESAGYPEDEFNNAVMVKLNATEETLMGGFVGKDEVTVGASAVAYLVRYGILAYGDEDRYARIRQLSGNFAEGYPEFLNMGLVHSNNEIDFWNNPTISGNTSVTACNELSGISGETGVDPIYLKPVDWDRLKADAEANGKIITEDDFPSDAGVIITDGERNSYETSGIRFIFLPHSGDHGGATYYFSREDFPEFSSLQIYQPREDWHLTNATIATELRLDINAGFSGAIYDFRWGGPDDQVVYIYAKGKSPTIQPLVLMRFEGTVIRYERDEDEPGESVTFKLGQHTQPFETTQFLRIISNRPIDFFGNWVNPSECTFNGTFAPPCPPAIVRLGRLD